jgi:hypothetical protein
MKREPERREARPFTSLRRKLVHWMGASTAISWMHQRMAGFQRMASSNPRAAEGVMTS